MKTVVFVMGTGHCGSTLLDLILGSHSRAFSLGEFRRLKNCLNHPHGEGYRICGVCEGKCSFWNGRASEKMLKVLYGRDSVIGSVPGRLLRQLVLPYRFIFRWSGADVLIDSSKNPGWIESQMTPSYTWFGIQPKLIYLVRDGRAVVNSYYRKYPERGIDAIVTKWREKTVNMNKYFDSFPGNGKIKIRYEELASSPRDLIPKVCEFLGLDYEDRMLRYWEHDHHHIFGNGGTRSLIYRYREQFKPVTSELQDRIEHGKKFYDGSYYDDIDIAISLDERWRKELSSGALSVFQRLAGDLNSAYEL